MENKDCPFCNLEGKWNRVLGISSEFNYLMIANRLSFVPGGSIMITTRSHAKSFGDLQVLTSDTEALEQEYQEFWELITDSMEAKYSEPIGFEHGNFSQSVNHAHWQLFPHKGKIIPYSGNSFSSTYKINPEDLFSPLKKEGFQISLFQPRTLSTFEEYFLQEGSYVAVIDSPETRDLVNILHTQGKPDRMSLVREIVKNVHGCELYDPNLNEDQRIISDSYLAQTIQDLRLMNENDIRRILSNLH
jgi:hypothetical protein